MKLRRAVAAAATTAVLAPAALLAAPAAYATETGSLVTSPTPDGSSSVTEPGGAEQPPAQEQGQDGTGRQDDTGESGAGESGSDTPGTPEGGAKEGAKDDKDAPAGGKDGKDTAVTVPGKPGNPGKDDSPAEGEEEFQECVTDSDTEEIVAGLRGLPSKVVAGSGWVDFTYRVTNESEKTLNSVDAYLDLGVFTPQGKDASDFLTFQWWYDGAWEDLDLADGYVGSPQEIGPGEYAEAKMRLKVDRKAPAALAVLISSAVHIGAEGDCEYTEDTEFEFEILAAGSKPGKVDDAEGKPGKPGGNTSGKPAAKTEPQGGRKDMPVTGNLAATGSSDVLPTLGIAGGIAVLAGAGVVFAVKRRRSDSVA
ncbi:LPXTG cell wall anchor domain-containing protein [Streptomyces sp. NPDC051018]|uniref:LPXTG cell wall anchor domain-containing protein n=1 Tax=Streptomyces sp. NPDC051018 TaxID=3365639 RepID=UPI0037A2812E